MAKKTEEEVAVPQVEVKTETKKEYNGVETITESFGSVWLSG